MSDGPGKEVGRALAQAFNVVLQPTRDEIASLRVEVARLTAELAAAKQERDALAAQVKDLLSDVVKSDLLDQQLEMTLNERDALAAALDKFGQHQPYCYETKTATEKGFIAPPYRHCTCGFSQVIEHTSAILATVRAKARAEGMRLLLREFSHWTPWGTREAVCDRIRAMTADAGEAGNMDGDK